MFLKMINVAVLVALTVMVFGCSDSISARKETPAPAPAKSRAVCGFTLGVEQHGERIPIDGSRKVLLDRAPFRLVFYFREYGSMLVNASFSPDLMVRADSGSVLDALLLNDAAIAEDFGNSDKMLCIRDEGQYQNWLCLGLDKHRFDSGEGVRKIPARYNGGYLCRRTVETLDTGSGTIEIGRCPSDAIYMLFVKTQYESGSGTRVEKHRECLEIRFRESNTEYSSR